MIAISITSLGNLRKKIELAFLVFDVDKNQTIDLNEMATLIQALYELLNFDEEENTNWNAIEKAKEIMVKLDSNKDNLLSRNEFIEGCIANREICEILVPYS